MYKESTIKKLEEEYDPLPLKEKIKRYVPFICYSTILICIVIGMEVAVHKERIQPLEERYKGEYYKSELKGKEAEIVSDELKKYMVDDETNTYIKMAKTEIGGKVAYSLTYRYDRIPTGTMTQTKLMRDRYLTSLLIHGYPYISYKEMGLKDEEEAYLATQLAVYEIVSQRKYSIANGTFYLDDVVAAEDADENKVERIVSKARELYNYAMENPYKDEVTSKYYYDDRSAIKDDIEVFGSFYIKTDTDETTKKFMGESFKPYTTIEAKSFIPESEIIVVNKDNQVVEKVGNEEKFYFKVKGIEKIFSMYRIYGVTYDLNSCIYETNENKKKYVVLESMERKFEKIESIISNIDSGNVKISFTTNGDNLVEKVSYSILDENKNEMQLIDAYSTDYDFTLPVGKYYIEITDIPEDYFIENKVIEFEIIKDEETNFQIKMDSVY